MKFLIASYLNASHALLDRPKYWDTIAILDSNLKPAAGLAELAQRHLLLRFDDITHPEPDRHEVELSDIMEAADFSRNSEACLVTCRAGQSRSAALSFALAYHFNGANDAIQLLDATRHVPNVKVLEVASAALEHPGIIQSFTDWKKANCATRLADYYNRLESEADALLDMGITNQITVG